jgi:predicted nucleic acid-binding protein
MGHRCSPKLWTDAYLAAFASVAGLTLVTFDRALGALVRNQALVLG